MLRRLGVADDPGQYQPNLQACLEAVLEQSDVLINDVLAGLQATLVPALGKKTALVLALRDRQTIETLCENAPAVRKSFAEYLRKCVFGGESAKQAGRQLMRFDDFQFLDADQIDANIEFAQSQQAVLVAVEDVLPTLNAMVSNLLGWSSVQAHLNPLKPDAFVHALRESMEEWVPDREARSTAMALASGLMGASLHQLYREVADWMRSQGVEPVHMAPTTNTGLWNPDNAAQSTVARTMLTLDKLRRLLSGELDPNPIAGGRMDFSHTIPASFEALQDMKLVEPMMRRLSDRASKTVASIVKKVDPGAPAVDMLAQEKEQVQRKKLGVQLGKEVVLLMLDNLMQDKRLLPPVRRSLKALEPVLVKLSEQDGRLFSERHHPARVFLDRMTHRSLAFSSEEAAGYARFQKAFDNAVSVLTGGLGDAATFARILRKLEDAWSREEAEQRQRAADAAKGLLHAEQRNLLAQRLSKQFDERLDGLEVPDMVSSFLRGPWAQVVAEAQLNFADGSVDPGGYHGLVEDLVWSVQLRLTRRNRARLVQMVPDMLVKMRKGLELISYPQERMAVFFDALISFHEQVFDSVRAPLSRETETLSDTLSATTAGHSGTPGAKAEDFWMVDSETLDSGFLEDGDLEPGLQRPSAPDAATPEQAFWSVDSLTTGSWVDLALADNWVRAQLTWVSPQRTLFMFISGSGMAHSMSLRTIDRLKASLLIRLVSDGRVMDNALDAVAQTALDNDLRNPKDSLPL
jgi:uncharacterized protein (DUF2384 family)